ncbi:hypothetical protein [Roseivivax sp. CAU 1753]
MTELNGCDIEDLEIGIAAAFPYPVTEAYIGRFDRASGDNTAVHINEAVARTTSSARRAAAPG